MATPGHGSSKISLLAAIVIGMNAMIGVGIVAVPMMMSKNVGPAGVLSYFISIVCRITGTSI